MADLAAYPGKGGQILEYAVETSLGTAGTAYGIRVEEGFDFPTNTKSMALPTQMGRQNWADTNDAPVTFEQYQEGVVKVPCYVRGHGTPTTKPPLVSLLESSGALLTTSTSVNITQDYAAAVDTDGVGGRSPGVGGAIEVDDGNHWPVLTVSQPAAASYTNTFSYVYPGSIATPANNDLFGAYTITPKAAVVGAAKTLSFNYYMRQKHTSNQMKFTASGCALAEMPKFTFEVGKPIKMDLSFHAADVALSDSAYSGGATTVVEQEEFAIWGGSTSQFAFDAWESSGGLLGDDISLIRAEVDLSHKTVPIIGTGTTATLNNLQGYIATPGHAKVTLDILCDASYWTDIQNGTFEERYIHFAVAGSSSRPFFGLFVPNCKQAEMPKMVDKRGDYIQVQLVYLATMGQWGGVTTVDTTTAAPWAIVMGRGVDA